ncbi:MAG: imidazole glycerol phosphate synthase subunit HisH [Gammaproteobacteria bacterium]|nr:imidazole glycerol phosphate synthase subunit HisH [Gammaproteobacteria bacterium]
MIGVIDYGLGNIKAFLNIYSRLNIPCKCIKIASDFESVDKIILPGVGAFDAAMLALNQSGLRESLNDSVLIKKKPVLGVCVGMQMMARTSNEGREEGLSWIDAIVEKIDTKQPLPHMGWNTLTIVGESGILNGLKAGERFYFLHSYYFKCNNSKSILATSTYSGDFCCVVNDDNIYGIQCHPEKSHVAGTLFLKNFAEQIC